VRCSANLFAETNRQTDFGPTVEELGSRMTALIATEV
jgi:hypothetical protein